jgi:hypothetical protein
MGNSHICRIAKALHRPRQEADQRAAFAAGHLCLSQSIKAAFLGLRELQAQNLLRVKASALKTFESGY